LSENTILSVLGGIDVPMASQYIDLDCEYSSISRFHPSALLFTQKKRTEGTESNGLKIYIHKTFKNINYLSFLLTESYLPLYWANVSSHIINTYE